MKVNVWNNKVSAREFQEFTFSEPSDPETKYTFRLRALDELERFAAGEYADALIVRYVRGNFVDPAGDHRKAPELLGLVADEKGAERPLEATEQALTIFAELERMQGVKRDAFDDNDEPDAYRVRELAMIAVTAPNVFDELRMAKRKVQAEARQKKASGPDSAGGSPTQG